jgi:hypothetical protein
MKRDAAIFKKIFEVKLSPLGRRDKRLTRFRLGLGEDWFSLTHVMSPLDWRFEYCRPLTRWGAQSFKLLALSLELPAVNRGS